MYMFTGSLSKEKTKNGKPFSVRYGDKTVEINEYDLAFYGEKISEMLSKIDVDDFNQIRIINK